MKSKGILLVAVLLAATVGAWLWFGKKADQTPASPAAPVSVPAHQPTVTTTPPGNSTEQALRSAANRLISAQSADEKKSALDQLRKAFAYGATNEVVATMRALLDSGTDASTGLGFRVGSAGSLLEAPTLRTLLLDQLGQMDPAAAAAYAKVILEHSDSPDEWAIALRNLARGDASAGARALLVTKTGELLRNEKWQSDPSVGYLEAFDTAVHLGGTDLLPPLSDLVRKKDNPAVAHAAFLTMDRLTINQAAQTLAALNEHPEWMTGREETRANYFARADVGDAGQRRLVESYLLETARSPAELQAFAGVFPNANFMISQNLLTQNATLDGATLRQRDQAALAVVNQWLADPKFEKAKPALTKIQQRLMEFTRQAK